MSILIAMGCRLTQSVDLFHVAHKWELGGLHVVHSYGFCIKAFFSHYSIFIFTFADVNITLLLPQEIYWWEKMHCDCKYWTMQLLTKAPPTCHYANIPTASMVGRGSTTCFQSDVLGTHITENWTGHFPIYELCGEKLYPSSSFVHIFYLI